MSIEKMVVMATVAAIGYADQGVGEDARRVIQELEDELIIRADQVASIARDVEGRYHAHICHPGASPGEADWGGLWEALFGLLFFNPAAALAAGAELNALRGHLDEAIDTRFRDQVREQVKPGTSALFMVIEQTGPDKALGALQRYSGTMIETSLSEAEAERLREALRMSTGADTSAGAGNRPG